MWKRHCDTGSLWILYHWGSLIPHSLSISIEIIINSDYHYALQHPHECNVNLNNDVWIKSILFLCFLISDSNSSHFL